MQKYIMALDAGTTSNRCIIFDGAGNIRASVQREFRQYYPKPGWVEHNADEIWETQLAVMQQALSSARLNASQIAAIGITNQRESVIVWDKATGKPVCPAIVWQCRRTAEYCDELRERGFAEIIRKKTGLVLDAYFSATKLKWILDNVPGARERAESGLLLFGTVDTWLIWKLTGGKVHATDYSNASRTMLYDIHRLCWDEELLNLMGIPAQMLPEVRPSSGIFGETDPGLLGAPVLVAGAAGDQQAALFGQTCFEAGEAKNTYGTGCFLLLNTGAQPVDSSHGLVTTIAWGLGGKITYALEGSIFAAGAAVQWLRDELGLISSAGETEALARAVQDTNGCYLVPAFTGLGAPYWDPYARGIICGLTRGVNKNHIVRATLESIAYQVCDVVSAMSADANLPLSGLRVDGGASANDFLMQVQADVLGAPVVRPNNVESTALGAAYFAGLAVGFWESREKLRSSSAVVFRPAIEYAERQQRLEGWRAAVRRARA
ncbi:MAG: glycerol kinase GlpK [Clostridiaceae bacterium]|nr:glycerol kinase GlpK [Clostridiaceae bacterium]NBI80712.1 glycerol kinase [Clostridiaceae bacterium]